MKPIKFPQANKTLTAPQGMTEEECGALPVFSNGGQCVSCWQPTLKERLFILIFGKVWLWVWSGYTQPPVALEGKRTIFSQGAGRGSEEGNND